MTETSTMSRWLEGPRGEGCHCHHCTDECHSDIPGHFIGARDCRFWLHDGAGDFCISTVGDWRPPAFGGSQAKLGLNRTYETMVFNKAAKGERHQEVEMRGYNSETDARAGHAEILARYRPQ